MGLLYIVHIVYSSLLIRVVHNTNLKKKKIKIFHRAVHQPIAFFVLAVCAIPTYRVYRLYDSTIVCGVYQQYFGLQLCYDQTIRVVHNTKPLL